MERFSPRGMIALGVALMLIGACLPLLMVIQVVTPTYPLSFLSYGASLVGMFLSFLGLFTYVRNKRN